MAADFQWAGEGGKQFVGDKNNIVHIVDAFEHHHKLIAAQACHCVHIAHAFGQAGGYSLEQYVASVVAEAVVNDFKTVNIEQH